MTQLKTAPAEGTAGVALLIRRVIRAPVERLFAMWTEPAHLLAWWGPGPVTCVEAQSDLRVGGRYRIANRLPDGKIVWIAGQFLEITRPSRLVYTWGVLTGAAAGAPSDAAVDEIEQTSRVTVRFEPRDVGAEVIISHEQIVDEAVAKDHEQGWLGCLDGLVAHAEAGGHAA